MIIICQLIIKTFHHKQTFVARELRCDAVRALHAKHIASDERPSLLMRDHRF
jgi:hypothetical protein